MFLVFGYVNCKGVWYLFLVLYKVVERWWIELVKEEGGLMRLVKGRIDDFMFKCYFVLSLGRKMIYIFIC